MTRKPGRRGTSWNYRVVRRIRGDEQELDVHKVYYFGDTITNWSTDPVAPHGETLEDVVADLKLMMTATDEPILEAANLPDHPEGESDS